MPARHDVIHHVPNGRLTSAGSPEGTRKLEVGDHAKGEQQPAIDHAQEDLRKHKKTGFRRSKPLGALLMRSFE